MKALKLFIVATVLLLASAANAQISVNVHIGSPPQWGPAGYSEARYYYLPDVEAYYDIHESRFIYYNGRTWVHRSSLPARYRNYDLYNGYKVVMTDYRGNRPYSNYREYRTKYSKGYRGHEQHNIGVRPGKGNSNSSMRYENNSNKNNGNGKGNGKNNKDNRGGGKDKK